MQLSALPQHHGSNTTARQRQYAKRRTAIVQSPKRELDARNTRTEADRTVLWGIIIGLLVVVVGALAYFALRPSEIPSEEPKTPEVTDTIPYETPTKQVVTPQIDTVKTAPVKKEIVEEEQKKQQHNRQENDSTDIYSDVDITE